LTATRLTPPPFAGTLGSSIKRIAGMKRYEQLAADISAQIHAGVLRPGDRIPSVRKTSLARSISPGTVLQAYSLLEDRGEIHTRPRSGYYVSAHWHGLPEEPALSRPPKRSSSVNVSGLVFEVLEAAKNKGTIPLGSAFPAPTLFPMEKLARSLTASMKPLDPWVTVANLAPGSAELRRQIARGYLDAGLTVPSAEIVITSGALEALNLCLMAVTRPGDVVAVESPAFYASLQAIERLGLKAVEIPTDPREGVNLVALAAVLKKHDIKACWFMTNFQNPLGCLMPDENKKELVRLLAHHGVPLIEDDVYGELYFGGERPRPAKSFDRSGMVMHCGSFSKCLAPGYRVGWVAAGKFARQVEQLKLSTTLSASIPAQMAIADYLKHGGYQHHLRKLRHALMVQQNQLLQALATHFPRDVRISRPKGGYFLWVELPSSVDTLKLHGLAMEQQISLAPGPMFSGQRKYANCLRLNYGHPWSPKLEAAIARLGTLIGTLKK
jgi:DNA-binding transcriptional MocR family regulator